MPGCTLKAPQRRAAPGVALRKGVSDLSCEDSRHDERMPASSHNVHTLQWKTPSPPNAMTQMSLSLPHQVLRADRAQEPPAQAHQGPSSLTA